jgi:GxxExxY protein
MLLALQQCGLTVAREVAAPVWFRGRKIGPHFADLIVERHVLLELKAARSIDPAHEAQLLHYLRATEIGLY